MLLCRWSFCVWFFKQKTAYELRISDWSSDVCSSDLRNLPSAMAHDRFMIFTGTANTRLAVDVANHLDMSLGKMTVGRFSDGEVMEIGRASCRARVCRYV